MNEWEQHSPVFVTYLTGALYVHLLWFYKHQHDNRVRSTQNVFSMPLAAILVNCAPSGEMHNYCNTAHHKRKLRISWSIVATTYCYLKCIVYDKLLIPRHSFVITLYYGTTVVYVVRRWQKRRYATHTYTYYFSTSTVHTAHHKRKLWEFLDLSLQLHTLISSVLCMTGR